MVTKENIDQDQTVRVTFELTLDSEANTVRLLGEFNNWQMTHCMERQSDNRWQTTLDLPKQQEFQFRYLIDEDCWVNDPQADRYAPNDYGEENCVVVT